MGVLWEVFAPYKIVNDPGKSLKVCFFKFIQSGLSWLVRALVRQKDHYTTSLNFFELLANEGVFYGRYSHLIKWLFLSILYTNM